MLPANACRLSGHFWDTQRKLEIIIRICIRCGEQTIEKMSGNSLGMGGGLNGIIEDKPLKIQGKRE